MKEFQHVPNRAGCTRVLYPNACTVNSCHHGVPFTRSRHVHAPRRWSSQQSGRIPRIPQEATCNSSRYESCTPAFYPPYSSALAASALHLTWPQAIGIPTPDNCEDGSNHQMMPRKPLRIFIAEYDRHDACRGLLRPSHPKPSSMSLLQSARAKPLQTNYSRDTNESSPLAMDLCSSHVPIAEIF
jgi:hypothetical protein